MNLKVITLTLNAKYLTYLIEVYTVFYTKYFNICPRSKRYVFTENSKTRPNFLLVMCTHRGGKNCMEHMWLMCVPLNVWLIKFFANSQAVEEFTTEFVNKKRRTETRADVQPRWETGLKFKLLLKNTFAKAVEKSASEMKVNKDCLLRPVPTLRAHCDW